MKYYVTADIHGFFTQFKAALTEAGFFADKAPHKLVVCGDLFDRGPEALALQDFILNLMDKDQVILIKGNHEDLAMDLVQDWLGEKRKRHHHMNGTMNTICQLTNKTMIDVNIDYKVEDLFAATPYITRIIPAMVDYFETDHYVFVHGWIPFLHDENDIFKQITDWRHADEKTWMEARWANGMLVAYHGVIEENKTIVCGHWDCSFGHFYYESNGKNFEEKSNFNPYYGKGIIAIDACTAFSGQVNCIVIED